MQFSLGHYILLQHLFYFITHETTALVSLLVQVIFVIL